MVKGQIEESKYNCNEKIDGTKVYYYFNPPNLEEEEEKKKDGIKKIAIGTIIIILYIIFGIKITFISAGIALFSIVYIIIGFSKVKNSKKNKAELESKLVSDEEYDKMERIMLQDIKEKGLQNLNLDEEEVSEAEPLILHRYSSGGVTKKGDDNKYRSTEHVSTAFYFAKDSLFIYKYSFSMKNNVTSEETLTLYYSDIVSVLVGSVEKNNGDDDSFGLQQLQIATYGGQTFTYQFISSDEIKKSINAMQSLFRSKKKEL